MGCCGDEDEDLLKQLLPDPPQNLTLIPSSLLDSSLEVSLSGDCESVISPMNSHFYALASRDILRSIFELLSMSDLARASCVCRLWNSVACEPGLKTAAFRAPWKLREVLGRPSSAAFWRENSLSRFAISHRLNKGDTIPGLALRYCVQVMDIKRLNNMMSDHGMYSRERLLIPISDPKVLHGGTCYIELDLYAKREVAVLYLDGVPDGHASYLMNVEAVGRSKKRLLDSMKRSLHADEGTVEYYLSISNGDPRAAYSLYAQDLTWEHQQSSTSSS
ncbi:hypothetical protein AMTRI_Chr03g45820 [Amborella trichopoda]